MSIKKNNNPVQIRPELDQELEKYAPRLTELLKLSLIDAKKHTVIQKLLKKGMTVEQIMKVVNGSKNKTMQGM